MEVFLMLLHPFGYGHINLVLQLQAGQDAQQSQDGSG